MYTRDGKPPTCPERNRIGMGADTISLTCDKNKGHTDDDNPLIRFHYDPVNNVLWFVDQHGNAEIRGVPTE